MPEVKCQACEGTGSDKTWPSVYLARHGGEYLGAARNFIQRKCQNGDRVTWGSHEDRVTFTVAQVEEMAVDIAVAALREYAKEIV